jgi:hypothetical protein
MSYVESTSWIEQVAWFGELSIVESPKVYPDGDGRHVHNVGDADGPRDSQLHDNLLR